MVDVMAPMVIGVLRSRALAEDTGIETTATPTVPAIATNRHQGLISPLARCGWHPSATSELAVRGSCTKPAVPAQRRPGGERTGPDSPWACDTRPGCLATQQMCAPGDSNPQPAD